MTGQPVWLGSISRRTPLGGGRLSTQVWSPQTMTESTELLRRLLGPVGNPARERIIRMQITLCIHRALTDEEVTQLPTYFHEEPPVDLAGGPVEVVWENEQGSLSTRPCEQPRHGYPPGPRHPLIWVPLDCGRCDPCRARAAVDTQMDAMVAALGRRLGMGD